MRNERPKNVVACQHKDTEKDRAEQRRRHPGLDSACRRATRSRSLALRPMSSSEWMPMAARRRPSPALLRTRRGNRSLNFSEDARWIQKDVPATEGRCEKRARQGALRIPYPLDPWILNLYVETLVVERLEALLALDFCSHVMTRTAHCHLEVNVRRDRKRILIVEETD